MSDILQKAFDPEFFRKKGHQVVDQLADHLTKMQEQPSSKVLDWVAPNDLLQQYIPQFKNQEDLIAVFEKILEKSLHLHHPKYMGHQTSVVAPMAALGEFFSSFLDVGMGVYEHGTAPVILEKLLLRKLAQKMGMDENIADGFLTSGGTLGNLTAMLCARAIMIKEDVWEQGYAGKKYAFLVSEEAHFSIDRAMRVMGLGKAGLVKVPTNDLFQLDTSLLEKYFQLAENQGVKIIGVVANACSTAVGAHDSIEAIADFCEAKKIWLHVDAAHGGGLLFSKKNRHLLDGIERADSVILDFHKMLLTPTLVTAIIFKNGNHSYQTFSQKADYMWDNPQEKEWFNLAKRTFELTKTTMSTRIYTLLKSSGEALFTDYVDRQYALGKSFAKILLEDGHFRMPVKVPESNIVCFRFLQNEKTEEELDDLNLKIRQAIVEDGTFFILQTRIRERVFLRVSLMNPFTTEKELQGLIQKIKTLASMW